MKTVKSVKVAEVFANAENAADLANPVPTVVADAQASKVLAVKKGASFRGARAAWYDLLCKYDGKPASEFLAAAEANRPSVYGAKSKHAGKPEPVAGWFRFFVRNGTASLI